MVIDEIIDMPLEIPVTRGLGRVDAKKFVIVQNHVRELSSKSNKRNFVKEYSTSYEIKEDIQQNSQERKLKKRMNKDNNNSSILLDENNGSNFKESLEISASDIEELRSVYNKCKSVIKKIELKYGNLLNISKINSDQSKRAADDTFGEECHCSMNTKIIFKDDGGQEIINTGKENHICPKKIKTSHEENQSSSKNIEIQYTENDLQLPDDLKSLLKMLTNSDMEISYRNKIIEKVRSLKNEYTNEIRFNKHSLIEKLKTNPEELLDFKGTNLSSLSGYS